MRLTEEQSRRVEENHNLIFWYMGLRERQTGMKLSHEEYYDLLAIELCYAVQKFDETKGSSLANYYKLRCDGLINKQYRKSQALKRVHISVPYIDDLVSHKHFNEDDSVVWANFIESIPDEDKEIVTLTYMGYTQKEIAEKLGLSQSYISKILKRIRKDYYANGQADT